MDREILFRGKRVDNCDWVYGDLSTHPESLKIWISQWEQNMGDFRETFLSHISYEIIPKTVNQFTGLTDRNGNKIFEGDIIQTDPEDKKMIVLWRKELGSFALYAKGWLYDHYFGEAVDSGYCKIIGNIHDNK